jgi:hypothetical protein
MSRFVMAMASNGPAPRTPKYKSSGTASPCDRAEQHDQPQPAPAPDLHRGRPEALRVHARVRHRVTTTMIATVLARICASAPNRAT